MLFPKRGTKNMLKATVCIRSACIYYTLHVATTNTFGRKDFLFAISESRCLKL